jgi:hypothetical protein
MTTHRKQRVVSTGVAILICVTCGVAVAADCLMHLFQQLVKDWRDESGLANDAGVAIAMAQQQPPRVVRQHSHLYRQRLKKARLCYYPSLARHRFHDHDQRQDLGHGHRDLAAAKNIADPPPCAGVADSEPSCLRHAGPTIALTTQG